MGLCLRHADRRHFQNKRSCSFIENILETLLILSVLRQAHSVSFNINLENGKVQEVNEKWNKKGIFPSSHFIISKESIIHQNP